jgi:pimeloyl-ACP methyl ester carboxylesterase
MCALHAAWLTPNVAKLVLYEPPAVDGAVGYPPGFIDELEDLIAHPKREDVLVRLYEVVLLQPPESVAQVRSEPVRPDRAAAAHTVPREARVGESYRFDPDQFVKLRPPTLLLEGEVSPPFLKASIAAVHAALPHSRLAVMSGQGHGAMRTAPQVFIVRGSQLPPSESL